MPRAEKTSRLFSRSLIDFGEEAANNSAVIDTGDNLTFRNAFNEEENYQAALDVDGDGSVNSGDNLAFRTRFNKTLSWTV
jgi:hypothetical protein